MMMSLTLLFPLSWFILLISFLSWKLLLIIIIVIGGRKASKVSSNDPAAAAAGGGPTSYPIIGCLLSFYKHRRRLLDWYTDLLSASPTQTIIISRLGARRTIITANPQNVEYMLKTNFTNFPKGKPFTDILGDFLGNGIFNVDGDRWHNQRKMAVHEFNVKSLRGYVENVLSEEVENKLLPVLESAKSHHAVVDLQDLLRNHAFDLVCKVSLGYDPCSLEYYHSANASHPIIQAFDVASEVCARRGAAPLSVMWKIKRLFNMGHEKRLKQAIRTIHSFIDDIIRDRKKMLATEQQGFNKTSNRNDLLSKMVLDGKDDEFVRDTMISFIMAGRDTTSAAMTWLFYLLSCHPHIEDEVVRELKENSVMKYESLNELRLLKACICESMRLYPPVAWDSKHAISNDAMPDGIRIRAGDRVTYFPYGMGRMEALWGEDRFQFKPERWISEQEDGLVTAVKNVSPYKFPVFQAGPRVCLGKEMAFIQMKYVVAAILKRFRIRPVTEYTPVFVPLLTAHMAGGFKVFVTSRN